MEDLRAVAPAMIALLELTETFAEQYRREKLRRNSADFSDQEHLALRLLVAPDGGPTELGTQVAARYQEILVDEYQDTNEVQNAIFRAVSRDGAEHLHRGRRQAEHLPFPPGGPYHFPGEVQPLPLL